MAYYWVQQWVALPVVLENQMPGDTLPDHGAPGNGQDDSRPAGSNLPFHSQYSAVQQPQAPQLNIPRTSSQQAQQYSVSAHDQGASMFNMNTLAGNLPQIPQYPGAGRMQAQHQGHAQISGASQSAVAYDLQHITQYPTPPPAPYSAGPILPGQYPNSYIPTQMPQGNAYGAFSPNQQRSFPHYPQQAQQFGYYYGNPYAPQGPMMQQYPGQQGRRPSLPSNQMPNVPGVADAGMLSGSFPTNRYSGGQIYPVDPNTQAGYLHLNLTQVSRSSSESNISSVPRGPPRKPKQSGHALWVGNLPPGTTVTDLKDHFSRDATKDIESLFLISKSNCAFVNYRTEASCTAAMHRFHDSRFHGVRLVCRLRRSSTSASGAPTGLSTMGEGRTAGRAASLRLSEQDDEIDNALSEKTLVADRTDGTEDTEANNTADGTADGEEVGDVVEGGVQKSLSTERVPEKFFIVKSLTMQDLEQSVRNGIWATQSHNEQGLNKAYESADNVYLIFSANKSGEYFGYARMASAISDDASKLINAIPKPAITEVADAPKSIPTPATEFAPRGRIIDDSARGTIFWEAELSESENDPSDEDEGGAKQGDGEAANADQEWGKPFKVEWISTYRLPFFKTRGLRNPWNANREVKIARDGTELETSVGKRLINMFPRGPTSALPNTPVARPY